MADLRYGKIVSTMAHDQYPRLSVRVSPTMRRRIILFARSRHKSQGAIVREALGQYFRGSTSVDTTIRDYTLPYETF
jgi:hypothetical protein